MLSNVSITCFAASYLVTLALEISRLFFRVSVRYVVMTGFTVAGLVAHTAYLFIVAGKEQDLPPLSNWHDWCLMASWVLALTYLVLSVRRPQNAIGLFFLPFVLAMVALAVLLKDLPAFSRTGIGVWHWLHGIALLVGTIAVTLGCLSGIMYLVQSWRLKNKLPPRQGLKLYSLEWLQRFNRNVLFLSTGALAFGLLTGVLLSMMKPGTSTQLSDPIVVSSGVLFLWLLSASVFEKIYKPAQQGRKVAYLTLASFVFLGLVLWFALQGKHGV